MFLARLTFIIVCISACMFYSVHSPVGQSASTLALTEFPVGSEPKSVAIGDFNSDGKKDLAVCNRVSQTVSILLGDGAGSFGAATNFPVTPEPFALAIGDFNNDGKSDVVVSNPTGSKISLLLGDGTGGLGAPASFSVGENPAKFAVGDFNGDSNSDLAVADFGSNNGGIYILLGNGTGGFGAATKLTTGPDARYVEIADFNVDGKSDLAVANVGFGFNKISIFIGNGSGGFSSPTDFVTGSSPIGLVVADFNQDTLLDIAVANTDSHNISILKGDGHGSFGPPVNFPANAFPLSIAAGDFNNDGKLDLAVGTNGTGDRISILLGDDSGRFAVPAGFSTGSGPYDLVSGDLNKDGKSDLAVANASTNNVSVLLGSFPSVSIGSVTLTEGDSGTKPANFTLTLSSATNKPVRVSYSIVSGTATGGLDFDSSINSGQLTIPADMLTADISIPIFGERTFEPDETFTINLSFPLNTFLANAQGQGTIVNDDPIPAMTMNDVSVVEGNTGTRSVVFTVNLSNASDQAIFVTLATSDGTAGAGSDYVARTASLSFSPSQVTRTFNVIVNGDAISEPNEFFLVNLTNSANATIARAQGVGTIVDDDAPFLLTEANSQRAIALDSVLWLRDPFPVINDLNFSTDHRTRIMLFAVNLNLAPGDVMTMQAEDAQQVVYQLPIEYVSTVPNFDGLTQVIVKLPDQIAIVGEVKVSFTLRGIPSNQVLLSIKP